MVSVWPNSVVRTRSSLDEMLELLQRREESDKPKDMPPALPMRPKARARARARPPCVKRALPSSFEVEKVSCNGEVKEEDETDGLRLRRSSRFGVKKVRDVEPENSPYVVETAAVEKDNSPVGLRRESVWDDRLAYFIEKKLRVWCWRRNCKWESGQIQSTSGEKASVLLSDGNIVKVPMHDLLPANPDSLGGVDDLTQLCYLNEPSILHNLQHRYSQDIVYSKAGPLLIAVNPLKDVQLYGKDLVTAYRQNLFDRPHVFAVANTAYDAMMTDGVNQSIIISGESGAGKTETAKITMQYLAAFGGDRHGLETELVQANYVLEAFGNAKTSRNINSSRFGKLTEIHFNATGQICGATIQTFLLEKSRVVELINGERSYHIFYQLCAGASSGLRDRLRLKNACDYNYLNQSDCLVIHEVDDAEKFNALMGALSTIGICKEDQEHVFEMLAAVLWLGNITFRLTDTENHIEVVADEAVTNAAALMSCKTQDLMLALSTHRIQAGKDEVTESLSLQQAIDERNTLAKFIYMSLFDWLVGKINLSLEAGESQTGRSISILDIYGFESVKKNGFEQFCINYANERLQQHVNKHLFKLEQEEYKLDGIDDGTKVDFRDNLDCLDLFEKKPTGLISLLDEESCIPEATDLTYATKLKQHFSANDCFKGERGCAFSVFHDSGEVLYDTSGFLDKNRDSLRSETIQLLSSCTSPLPRLFASALLSHSKKPAGSLMQLNMLASEKQSVATRFKGQLFKLIQQLESTKPHFIRCINPNRKQLPGIFENELVLEQLRCGSVLEVVKISRSGYPCRMTHLEFTRRYGFLLPENNMCQDPLSISVAILQQFGIPPSMYRVAYAKLYFRAGQIDALEDVRKQMLRGTYEAHKHIHRHRARPCYSELREGVVTLQSYIRGELSRKEYVGLLRKKHGAIQKLDRQLMAAVQIQSVFRGWLARKRHLHVLISNRSNVSKQKPVRRISEVKDLTPQILPSVVEELQKRLLVAEATIGQREKENETLTDQMQLLEARCSGYEAKMKSMEELWQKQIASLQMKLAAEDNFPTDYTTSQHGRPNGTQSPSLYDSEDMSFGPKTPEGSSTPLRFKEHNGIDSASNWDTNSGIINALSPLVKEFEQRKQTFNEAALAIADFNPRSSSSHSANPVEELRRLKERFGAWTKDYKARLRETKVKVYNGENRRRKWWGLKFKL